MKERLLQIADYLGLSVRAFELKCGLQRGNISNMSENGAIGSDKLSKIIDSCSDINIEWLLTGRGTMLNAQNQQIAEPQITLRQLKTDYYDQGKQDIPLFELDTSAGLSTLFTNQNQNIPLDSISIPNAPKCDGATFVRGDSMYPLLKSGDIVCYRNIYDINNIIYGEMYILYIESNGDERLVVKYVQKSDKGDNYFTLASENRYHAAIDVLRTDVKTMAIVKASIRYNSF